MDKIASKKYPIRFQDCDPFKHLNNSKYLDYFVNAREDHSREKYNLDLADLAMNRGLGWVVTQHNIAYLRPAIMSEIVVIETQLIKYTSKSLLFEMTMWNESKTQIKSVNWTELVMIDINKLRPTDHTEEMESLFKKILLPVSEIHFDDRIQYYKELNKKS